MTLAEQPDWVKSALCMAHALRSLGFSADEVFFYVAVEGQTGEDAFFVAAHENGDKNTPPAFAFAVERVSVIGQSVEGIFEQFTAATVLWNKATRADALALFERQQYFDEHELVAILAAKGHGWRWTKAKAEA